MDHSSSVERNDNFAAGSFDNGGYTGFLINTWSPDQQYADADFDIRHQINVNWVTELPFGHGKKFGKDVNGFVNAFIGDWSLAGLWRWTSGFPFNVQNCRSCWATNWNLQGNASLVNPGSLPSLGTTKDKVNDLPSPFTDPTAAIADFRRDYPGESGLRNVLRGDGYFTIDTSIAKGWSMPWSPSVIRSNAGCKSCSSLSAARRSDESCIGFAARVLSSKFANSNASLRFGVMSERSARFNWCTGLGSRLSQTPRAWQTRRNSSSNACVTTPFP